MPEGRKCDITSLCAIAGVPRATLYRTYPHLKAQFDQQRAERLQREIATLRGRLSSKQTEIDQLSTFRHTALSRIAAQHEEILRLRTAASPANHLTALPTRPAEP